jgi:hypothetical protein
MVEDDQVFAGMKFALDAVNEAATRRLPRGSSIRKVSRRRMMWTRQQPTCPVSEAARDGESDTDDDAGSDDILDVATPFDAAEQPNDELPADVFGATSVDTTTDASERATISKPKRSCAVPSKLIVRSAPRRRCTSQQSPLKANAVATSRREELRAAVMRAPQDWVAASPSRGVAV